MSCDDFKEMLYTVKLDSWALLLNEAFGMLLKAY